jgi:Zn finger protein HypA/HybF involved in hydrogenase expression
MDFEIVEDFSEIEEPDVLHGGSVTNGEELEDVELFHCNYCGSCIDPDTCVFGVSCPKCNAPERQLCREQSGSNRLVGLHEERWRLAKGREYAWRD